MELKTLQSLVKQGEGLHLEFKLKTNHPEKIIKEIVAFANTEGGKLIVGVSDDKEIKGLKYADEDEFVMEKYISTQIFPEVNYSLERIKVDDGKVVLIYNIPESQTKPHFVKTEESDKVYVRVKDKSIQASKEMREILKGQNKGRSFKFHFGEKEKILFKYLDENENISIANFAQIANIAPKMASRTLVLLVLAGVLKIFPNEKEDLFSLN